MQRKVKNRPLLISDIASLLFSPHRFLKERFLKLESSRIYLLGFIGVFLGLLLGSLINLLFCHLILQDFLSNSEPYLTVLEGLGIKQDNFLELLKAQRAYSIMLAVLSPIIAYIAPHLFGGALFVFLWLFNWSQNNKLNFFRVMECSAISLAFVAYYTIPGLGPLIALILLGINLSRALSMQYKLIGFVKIVSIISAIYFCFVLTSITLQLLAIPIARMLN